MGKKYDSNIVMNIVDSEKFNGIIAGLFKTSIFAHGEMAERSNAAVLKTVDPYGIRGFESLSLRQTGFRLCQKKEIKKARSFISLFPKYS